MIFSGLKGGNTLYPRRAFSEKDTEFYSAFCWTKK